VRRLVFTAIIAIVGVVGLPALGQERTPSRTVLSCLLAGGDKATLKAIAHGPKGADGDDLFVETGGKTERAFLDMPDTEFRGTIVLATCVRNILIFAVNYGTPYLKGVAMRENPKSRSIERLYFAEKALPRWLFENDRKMIIIVPNKGYETDKKYLVYEYTSGIGQPEDSTPTDKLPKPIRQLIKIR
jgi:hypothetical protein